MFVNKDDPKNTMNGYLITFDTATLQDILVFLII